MERETADSLVNALRARSGIVAVVGAGGKKSTLYRLLEAHRALGRGRILLTSTVQLATAPKALDVETIILGEDGDADAALARVRGRDGAFLFAGPPMKADTAKPLRYSGLPQRLIPHLHAGGPFDVSLVKADGARMRMIKAPRADEPALPDGVTTLLPIVSARVFGRALTDRLAHRPERLIEVIDADIGTELAPQHVARWLSSPAGALQHAGDAAVVPIINMVEGRERLDKAREAARRALAITDRFERVILAAMHGEAPLVDIVRR